MIAFPEHEYRAKVTRVIDGHTVEVNTDLGFNIRHVMRVRLAGVDTPEIFRPKDEDERTRGKAAKRRVEELIADQWVAIKTGKGRSFNRWNADVYYYPEEGGRKSLGETLVEEGHAIIWE